MNIGQALNDTKKCPEERCSAYQPIMQTFGFGGRQKKNERLLKYLK